MCSNLRVLEVLIEALKDPDTTQNPQIFLYVYGGMLRDVVLQRELYELIDNLNAKVLVSYLCESL
jgi:hypothetical protein